MAYSVGQRVHLGTLRVNGTYYEKPSRPWRTDDNSGNLINYNGTSISIENTQSGKALEWIYVEDKGKKLLICDRNLVATVSWDNLNSANLIFGKEIRIDGKKYKIRSMTGGTNDSDENNEWSRIIENNQYGIGNSDGTWHWDKCYTWCQETHPSYSNQRILRGYSSASSWDNSNSAYSNHYSAFRPVLEILNTAPLISDSDRNLGNYQSALVKDYSVSDAENQRFTLVEKIDSTTIRTLTNQNGGSYQINLSSRWADLSNGSHTIEIRATDSEGETSIRRWTFNKTNTPPSKPFVDYPVNNQRTGRSFDVIFRPQRDSENNPQSFTVEVANNSSFTSGKQTFSGLKKQSGSSWINTSNFTNSDYGTKFKISVNLNDDSQKYLRLSTVDASGSNTKVYSDVIKISSVNILQIKTLPYQTKYLPKAVNIKLDAVYDNKVGLKVEVCNNANDTNPTWENATESYKNDTEFVFTNKTKQASSYAVSARVTLTANDSTAEISIKAVGMGVR